MPKYTFCCESCNDIQSRHYSVPEFVRLKKEKIKCTVCENGVLYQKIIAVSGTVDKDRDQIMMDAKEEVRKTVEKVRSGDRRAMDDIYGDKLNPYKK